MHGLKAGKGIANAMGLAGGTWHGMGGGRPRLEGTSRAADVRSGSPLAGLSRSRPLFAATSSRPRSSPGWRPSVGTCSRFRPPACKSGLWKSHGRGNGQARYEVMIGPDVDAPEQVRILSALQGLLKYAMTGGGAHPFRTLLEELRDVSKVHGEVLEGFGRMPQGIPIRFN